MYIAISLLVIPQLTFFPLIYNIYLWFLNWRHFHLPCLCLNQIQNDKAVRIRGGGWREVMSFFSPLLPYLLLPHHFPPFKSVTHYMSGQRGGWNQILFASPSLTWISLGPTVTAQREREGTRERERWGRRVYKRIERRRGEAEREESSETWREREGKLGRAVEVCVVLENTWVLVGEEKKIKTTANMLSATHDALLLQHQVTKLWRRSSL